MTEPPTNLIEDQAAAGKDLPPGMALCVDLDGTLVKSDTLVDSVLVMARQRPGSFLKFPAGLRKVKPPSSNM